MTLKSVFAAVGTAALTVGLATGAMADAPPAAAKKAYKASATAEHYERPHVGNWGGLYIGVNVGWAGADLDWAFNPPNPAGTNQSWTESKDEAILGGHIGLQHQFGNIVAGIEIAYSGTGAFGNGWARHDGYGVDTGSFADAKWDSLWQFGGRLGWAASSQWMLYATGGFASATIQTRLVDKVTGIQHPAFDTSARHDGWYFGAGVEYAMAPNWVLGLEYQHVDLGSESHCKQLNIANGNCATNFNTHDMNADVDIVRFRLSYKIGRAEYKAVAEPMK